MRGQIIIIRGNSGSGKSYLGQQIQRYFGNKDCFLISQDKIRREVLKTDDQPGTLAVPLLEDLLLFGQRHYLITILEGILRSDTYGAMLEKFINQETGCHSYYLKLTFEQTLVGNQAKALPFSETTLRQWWRSNDYFSNDVLLTAEQRDQWFNQILADVVNK